MRVVRELQERTGGITEFVPLSFIPFQTLLGRTHGIEEISREENLKHTAAFRLALGRSIKNLQASWVKMGLDAATESLRWGVNDLGGTLMEENISRMAGSQHGVRLEPGRPDRRRPCGRPHPGPAHDPVRDHRDVLAAAGRPHRVRDWVPYRSQSLTQRADRVIAALAGRQRGVVARGQLLRAGVTGRQIKRRRTAGRLHEVHRGVYLVGHTVAPRLAFETAALLACGPRAVLSHRTAAALWELFPYPAKERVCVTVPPGHGAARPNLRIHRTVLDPRDVRRRDDLAVTSPPRTILDLSTALADDDLERIVAEAHYRRLASERELIAQLERNPRKRGARRLRRVLDLPGGPQRTRSPAERALLRLLRANGVTGFECNARICGYEVDFLWRDRRFAVEVDGYDAHSGRAAFERDRLKLATLQANGVRVMPVSGRRVERDPDGVLDRLLAARG